MPFSSSDFYFQWWLYFGGYCLKDKICIYLSNSEMVFGAKRSLKGNNAEEGTKDTFSAKADM